MFLKFHSSLNRSETIHRWYHFHCSVYIYEEAVITSRFSPTWISGTACPSTPVSDLIQLPILLTKQAIIIVLCPLLTVRIKFLRNVKGSVFNFQIVVLIIKMPVFLLNVTSWFLRIVVAACNEINVKYQTCLRSFRSVRVSSLCSSFPFSYPYQM